jgi:phosphoribosylformylglycinamidine cyclo-ligase
MRRNPCSRRSPGSEAEVPPVRHHAAGASSGATYAAAGVDIDASETAVERLRVLTATTDRPGVLGGIGGFGGLFKLDTDRCRRPVLVSSTDGVGTKLAVARAAARYDTVGIDLVAMCVDDVVCSGAEPLFLLDYVAAGKLDPARVEQVVSGVAAGCRKAGCALLGGETAEHPGVMDPDDLDLAGFALGVVEEGEHLGPHLVRPGDVLVGIRSPGLRSNGYSLARHVLLERASLDLAGPAWPGATHSLADELLRPSEIYAPAVLAGLAAGAGASSGGVHACAHVTGGGIRGNLVRVLPQGCDANVERAAWSVPRIFTEIARLGEVSAEEMERVFNLGLGMVLVVGADAVDAVTGAIAGLGPSPVVVGEVREGSGEVHLR